MNCPHCGGHIPDPPRPAPKRSRHNLSEKHVRALWKLRGAVKFYGRNELHLRKDLMSTKLPENLRLNLDEWTNFTKLRFHALAFKVKEKPGYWGITDKGGAFLRGEQPCMKHVFTEADSVVGHEGPSVWIWEVDKGAWWERPLVERETQQTLV